MFGARLSACVCDWALFGDEYIMSDYVGLVKIGKKVPSKNKNYDKYEIKKQEHFKGEEISYLYKRKIIGIGNSCDFYMKLEGEELLLFITNDRRNKPVIGYCTPRYSVKRDGKEKLERHKEILRILKNQNIKNFEDFGLYYSLDFPEGLSKNLNEEDFENKFAIFQIDFDENLALENVEILSGFGKNIDEKIIDKIKNSKWNNYSHYKIEKLYRKTLIILRYDEKNKEIGDYW